MTSRFPDTLFIVGWCYTCLDNWSIRPCGLGSESVKHLYTSTHQIWFALTCVIKSYIHMVPCVDNAFVSLYIYGHRYNYIHIYIYMYLSTWVYSIGIKATETCTYVNNVFVTSYLQMVLRFLASWQLLICPMLFLSWVVSTQLVCHGLSRILLTGISLTYRIILFSVCIEISAYSWLIPML